MGRSTWRQHFDISCLLLKRVNIFHHRFCYFLNITYASFGKNNKICCAVFTLISTNKHCGNVFKKNFGAIYKRNDFLKILLQQYVYPFYHSERFKKKKRVFQEKGLSKFGHVTVFGKWKICLLARGSLGGKLWKMGILLQTDTE